MVTVLEPGGGPELWRDPVLVLMGSQWVLLFAVVVLVSLTLYVAYRFH